MKDTPARPLVLDSPVRPFHVYSPPCPLSSWPSTPAPPRSAWPSARVAEVLAERSMEIDRSSGRLLEMIAEVLAEAGAKPADLGGVVALAGPGSFTGLRIGLATALGLHQALGVPATASPPCGCSPPGLPSRARSSPRWMPSGANGAPRRSGENAAAERMELVHGSDLPSLSQGSRRSPVSESRDWPSCRAGPPEIRLIEAAPLAATALRLIPARVGLRPPHPPPLLTSTGDHEAPSTSTVIRSGQQALKPVLFVRQASAEDLPASPGWRTPLSPIPGPRPPRLRDRPSRGRSCWWRAGADAPPSGYVAFRHGGGECRAAAPRRRPRGAPARRGPGPGRARPSKAAG